MTGTNSGESEIRVNLITGRAAARILSTSERHVHHLVRTRQLPVVFVGGKRRFIVQDLEDFVDRCRRANDADRTAA